MGAGGEAKWQVEPKVKGYGKSKKQFQIFSLPACIENFYVFLITAKRQTFAFHFFSIPCRGDRCGMGNDGKCKRYLKKVCAK